MADKNQQIIVIKKITINGGGAHGGAWKVALADFMTALMCFFLVMWLISTAQENVKKNVADYFSTPSVVEYEFSNYGVELTLEKLFLDLINEPLKFFQSFITPIDKTPNIMSMGSKRIVLHHLADQLGSVASNVSVTSNSIYFEIPDPMLFKVGSVRPSSQFVEIMDKIKGITTGLEDSIVYIDSQIYTESVQNNSSVQAKKIVTERLEIVKKHIEIHLENQTTSTMARDILAESYGKSIPHNKASGKIVIEIKQKDMLSDGKKPRTLEEIFGPKDAQANVYDNFVKQLSNKAPKKSKDNQNNK